MMRAAVSLQMCLEVGYFPMNLDSCYTYGACTYLNLCEQNRTPGEEVLDDYFIDPDPWDVTKEVSKDDIIRVEEDTYGI